MRQIRDDRSGFVMVLMAISLLVLVALGGFAVDLGNWYLHAQRMQRASDSAALAGTVFLPSDLPRAQATAMEVLQLNGAAGMSPVITQSPTNPSRLQVQLTGTVENYFTSLLGYDRITLSRSGAAVYRHFIEMGGPSNVMAQEPNSADRWQKASTVGQSNNYWLEIDGGRNKKESGDRYSAGRCTGGTDRCSGGSFPNGNQDFLNDGNRFIVRIPLGFSGQVRVQAYDAPFGYAGGSACDRMGGVTGGPEYAPGRTPYCTGDASDTGEKVDTTFGLWTPNMTPGGSSPVLSCPAITYPGERNSLSNAMNNPVFASGFSKWATLCTLSISPSTPPGDYILHVKTNLNGTGQNRFGLRVGAFDSAGVLDVARTAGLSVFSPGKMVIYAKEDREDVKFYLARIDSSYAGMNVKITLFDIGEAAGSGSVRVVPPADGNVGGTFNGCTYKLRGVTRSTSNGCQITGITRSEYNKKLVDISIPIPASYSCNDADPNGCWTRLNIKYGGAVVDTSSWDANVDGAPVRLVK